MFEFTREVVHRGGYRFTAELKEGKFIYATTNKKEIEVLESNWFKAIQAEKKVTKAKKNESNK